jgi:hypothetical protein
MPGFLRGAALVASLVAFAPTTAHAYCRTTTTPLPASYSPTRGCFTEGLPLYWKNACVGYAVEQTGATRFPFEATTAIIDEAFATWGDVTCTDSGAQVGIGASNLGPVSCDEVRYNPTGPNQNVIIFRENGWPYSDPNNTLGLTTITFNADNGEIFDADMEINASGGNLSITEQVPSNGFDLASVVTHEAGHFFGLAHSTDSRATMFASYRPGSSALRTLAQDDADGVCEIYPSPTERTVDRRVAPGGVLPAGPCDTAPRHGFGSACAANPTSEEGGCTMASAPATGPGAATALGLALAVAFSARRRRSGRAA